MHSTRRHVLLHCSSVQVLCRVRAEASDLGHHLMVPHHTYPHLLWITSPFKTLNPCGCYHDTGASKTLRKLNCAAQPLSYFLLTVTAIATVPRTLSVPDTQQHSVCMPCAD